MSIEDLLRFRDGDLPVERVVPLSRHLAACAACAALAQEMFAGDIEQLGRALEERELARSQRITRIVFAAAAAAILIVIALAVLLRPSKSIPPVAHRPPPRTTTPSRWDAVKAEALHAGFIAAPAVVDSVRILPSEQVRGLDSDEPATALQPNGVVLDDARPRFRWHVKGGATATVSVFGDGNLVIRSPAVRGSEWTPERDLPRGAVYQWQLEVKKRKKTYTVPAAPARPPSFAIVDEESHRRLADARREAPGDHLLLGILAAHAGLQAEALEELDRYSAAHPGDAAARALEASVRHWTVR